ncbi:MAG: proprotein convertase P-domain-containing protein, partial [Saprospiraceae bacterium]|nr:proprotein convertase P-domain-containing protein [Saprospiraceae bacterium]
MKNYFTLLSTVLIIVFTISGIRGSMTVNKGNEKHFSISSFHDDDCFVYNKRVSIKSLVPWLFQSAGILAACPQNIVVNLGPGECSSVVNFDFALTPLVPTPPDITTSQNVVSGSVNSTIYCATGQTRYSRTFTHSGPTSLNIHTINIGVYLSSNSPAVTVNIYDAGNVLLTSTTNIIPDINLGTYDFPVANTVIPSGQVYTVEIVANAPWVSIFKIGRNDSGNLPGFNEAVISSLSCASNQLTVEGNVGANSIVLSVIGTPDEYKITKLPYGGIFPDNNLNSGDEFPIGVSNMHYSVTTAAGNIILDCQFFITVNGFANPVGSIACHDLVQVSLGDDCEAIVTPQMILQGDNYGCYEDYTVKITGLNGANLGNLVTKANVGQKLNIQISGPNGNSCWGEILVEDKYGPNLICTDVYATCSTDLRPGSFLPARVPVTARITDGTLTDATASVKSFTIPVNNLAGSTITDLNVFIDVSHTSVSDLAATLTAPDGTTITLFINPGGACTEDNMMVTMDDEAVNGYAVLSATCDITDPSIAGTFKPLNALSVFDGDSPEGDWVVTIYDQNAGEGGNVNHIDLIFSQTGGKIPFPTPNPVTFIHVADNIYIVNGLDACGPATLDYVDTVVEEDCSSIYSKIIKRCWNGSDALGNPANNCCQFIYVYRNGLSTLQFPPNYDGLNGNPGPLSCEDYGTTVPPTSVTGLPTGDLCYNVQIVPPTDIRIDICEKSYKLIRTHKVIEWCSGQVIVHNQIIKVMDTLGPELVCPVNVTISTDDYQCTATYFVPVPNIINECSDDLTYLLSYNPHNTFDVDFTTVGVNQFEGSISGLPLGESWISWTVSDECGNSTECRFKVTVVDNIRPIAVCDQYTIVSLSGNGVAVVDALTFDDGSFDNCGILRIEARKMTDKCGFGNSIFTPTVAFCCSEVNTSIMVEFRVTDLSGNSNTCMVEVKVNDKLPPYITICPPDITLDCQADYNDFTITKEPEYLDNCEVIIVKHQDQVNINSCGVGTIIRTWTVEDKQGLK